jgi:hypothetical protein
MFETLPFKCRQTSKTVTLGVSLHGAMLGLQDRDAELIIDLRLARHHAAVSSDIRGSGTGFFLYLKV